jgi:uncharacterized repeat protein (TIGR03803 family)
MIQGIDGSFYGTTRFGGANGVASVASLGKQADFITVDVAGQYVFLSDIAGDILTYAIGSTGALTLAQTLPVQV